MAFQQGFDARSLIKVAQDALESNRLEFDFAIIIPFPKMPKPATMASDA